MIVGAVVLKNDDTRITNYNNFLSCVYLWVEEAILNAANIVVFPGLFSSIYENSLDAFLEVSSKYKDIFICPGSYFEVDEGKTYHSSCIIHSGDVIFSQRQLYLALWERELGLSRGDSINFIDIEGFKTAIILSTDSFYPQVSRYIAMNGGELVLCPSAVIEGQPGLQLSGLWQNVQQNLFFAVESGFKGDLFGKNFYTCSSIQAPLEITKEDDGFLALENITSDEGIIAAKLDNKKRKEGVKKFDILGGLNINLYKGIFR